MIPAKPSDVDETRQTTDVADAQPAVLHMFDATRKLGVVSSVEKLTPLTVATAPLVAAEFSANEKLTLGVGNQGMVRGDHRNLHTKKDQPS